MQPAAPSKNRKSIYEYLQFKTLSLVRRTEERPRAILGRSSVLRQLPEYFQHKQELNEWKDHNLNIFGVFLIKYTKNKGKDRSNPVEGMHIHRDTNFKRAAQRLFKGVIILCEL